MSDIEARHPGVSSQGGARPDVAHSGVLITFGMVLAGALLVLALLSTGSAEPVVLAILALLAMVGVFFLFAMAAGLVNLSESGGDDQLLRLAADGLDDGIQITAADGSIIYTNDALARLAGVSPAAAPGALERLFAGEPQAAEALFRLSRAAERGEPRDEEFKVRGGDGGGGRHGRWYRLGVKPLNAAGPGAAGVAAPALALWKLSDITSARASEAEALHHAALRQAGYESLPVGLLTLSKSGVVEAMNPALAGWLGLDPDGIGERRLKITDVLGDQGPDVLAALSRQRAGEGSGGRPQSLDVEAIGRHGEPVALRIVYRAADTAKGAAALSAMVLNRSHGNMADLEVDANDLRLARFFQTAPFGIATVDRDGRITSNNGSFARMFFAERESKSLTISSLLSRSGDGDARDALTKALQRVVKDRASVAPVEVALGGPKGDGSKGEQTRRVYVTPFETGEDAREAAILYAVDTSEQKALELKFAQSQKMEAVGQLAGGIAHDFNNVLTVIIGLSDLFLQTRRPTDAGYMDISQIRSNANRAAGMVRQLLAFSRKQTLSSVVLSLNEVVQDLGYSLSRLLGERVELKMHCKRDLWMVKADQTQFEQVMINLAVNARDAMPDGGRLTIRTKNVTERDSMALADLGIVPGEYVLVEVKDSGTGMAPEVVEKIFEPFYSTKDVGKGTGLGLSTVYGIVKQTGGYVFPESKPGKGTTFRVYLPRHHGTVEEEAVATGAKSAKKAPPRDLTGSGRVLLVEDEDGVRNFAVRALTRQGYEVLEATTGVEALEVMAANEGRIDIVVSDVVMPEMDGPTLLTEARKTNPDLKFIFVSGYPDDAFKNNLDETAKFAFLPKPFTLPQLAAKVKEQLEEG